MVVHAHAPSGIYRFEANQWNAIRQISVGLAISINTLVQKNTRICHPRPDTQNGQFVTILLRSLTCNDIYVSSICFLSLDRRTLSEIFSRTQLGF